MKSGFVSIIGRPNVGKSTLLNTIVGEKIAITSDKPQTTRNLIQGIYNDADTQIVFIDTPGIHKPINKLGNRMNAQSYYSIDDVDVLLLVMDASSELGSGDKFVLDKISYTLKPVILVLNKIDKLTNDELLLKITEYKDIYDFSDIVPISALKKDNVNRLIDVIKKYLTDNVKYFMDDEITSASDEFRICEAVRESILNLTNDEVPYSVTCVINNIEKEKDITNVYVDIIVDRENLKKIIIGKKGIKLKEIGIKARGEIEKILGSQVYLELYVKTLKKWRDKEKYFTDLGFNE